MPATDPTTQKGTVESFRERDALIELGTDAAGDVLFYNDDRHEVLAVRPGGGIDRKPLGERSIDAFQQWITQEIGWAARETRILSAAGVFAE